MSDRPRKPRLARIAILAALLVAGACVYFADLIFRDNLHEVVAGEVYRSAAPEPASLERWVPKLGLRSIIDLKGGSQRRTEAFERESKLADELGIELRSVRMSAQRWPAPGELDRLIAALDASPRPVLLHCEAGVDRTGLAAAVALLIQGAPPAEANGQFRLRYGYPGPTLGSTLPGFIEAYERWLEQQGLRHEPERFRAWIHGDYIAGYYEAELELLTPMEEAAAGGNLTFEVRITNRSPLAIPLQCEDGGVFLSIAIQSSGPGEPFRLEHRRCRPGAVTLEPGGATTLSLDGFTLPRPGPYEIKIDLVDEKEGHTFESMGSRPYRRRFAAR